jgi:hypothetical protein
MRKTQFDKLNVYLESKNRFKQLKPEILKLYGIYDKSDAKAFDKVLDIIEESLKEQKADRAKNV